MFRCSIEAPSALRTRSPLRHSRTLSPAERRPTVSVAVSILPLEPPVSDGPPRRLRAMPSRLCLGPSSTPRAAAGPRAGMARSRLFCSMAGTVRSTLRAGALRSTLRGSALRCGRSPSRSAFRSDLASARSDRCQPSSRPGAAARAGLAAPASSNEISILRIATLRHKLHCPLRLGR